MFLEFISNLSEKFRIFIYEIQEMLPKKSETFFNNSEKEKKKEPRMRSDPTSTLLEVELPNHYKLLDLF